MAPKLRSLAQCSKLNTTLALQSPIEISLGLLGVGLAVVLRVSLSAPDEHQITVFSDAIGLAAFATTGAIVAREAGISAFGIVAIATINAVGGGAFAGILLDRSPFILFDDFYWRRCVAYATVTVTVRLVAVSRNWHIPTV